MANIESTPTKKDKKRAQAIAAGVSLLVVLIAASWLARNFPIQHPLKGQLLKALQFADLMLLVAILLLLVNRAWLEHVRNIWPIGLMALGPFGGAVLYDLFDSGGVTLLLALLAFLVTLVVVVTVNKLFNLRASFAMTALVAAGYSFRQFQSNYKVEKVWDGVRFVAEGVVTTLKDIGWPLPNVDGKIWLGMGIMVVLAILASRVMGDSSS